jgi:indolepyruvate ferredoxin oxidoreductase alpha subunit
MRRAAAVRSVAKSSERSFDAEVAKLALGAGQILRGEAVLAIAKGLLQAGVSYLGGYPGAPV